MRGIEAAFWGTLGRDPELKQSRAGKAYCGLNVAVTTGEADSGSGNDATTWVRATCFGVVAEKISDTAKKGDRVYIEGNLTLNTWQPADGPARTGLNVAAWKCERLGNIGKSRERRERDRPEGVPVETMPGTKGYQAPIGLEDEIPF